MTPRPTATRRHLPPAAPALACAALIAAAAFLAAPSVAVAGACSNSVQAAHRACGFEVKDDYWQARAICQNESDPDDRAECFADAEADRAEAKEECTAIREARLDLCDQTSEDPYDPDLDPADFDDDFTALTNPNPFFLLEPGNQWVLEGGTEVVTIQVLAKTKLIAGITCVVVNDVVTDNGDLIEDTDDWYGQATVGDVHYCGELARDYETFEDDDPAEPELVSIEGSFKNGRDGAKSGLLLPFLPEVGDVFRQEWALGDAEDAVEVLSTDYQYGVDRELDEFVPADLANLLCGGGDCLVTRDFTPLDPEAFERKYYAPGVGLFLEVDPETGDTLQLTSCNVSALCGALP